MLTAFGANVWTTDTTAHIEPATELFATEVNVPGDISSAAYFIAAGLIVPGSELLIKNVGINPTRDGIIRVVKAMGGNISLLNERTVAGEAVADILVKHSNLHATTIEGEIIPTLIDEIPIIAILAAFADGTTTIKDAAELKVKESNRIDLMVNNLKAMGADIVATDDGMIINGGKELHGATIQTNLDHRIAMSFAIAGLNIDSEVKLDDYDCVNVSYPGFFETIESLL